MKLVANASLLDFYSFLIDKQITVLYDFIWLKPALLVFKQLKIKRR